MENTDKLVVEEINRTLKERYGQTIDGRPLFRIVWTSDQLEKRIGWHEEYTPSGNIFIRRWFGMKECLKYNYMMDRWALERLSFLGDNKIMQTEIADSRNGTYEMIYCFISADGHPLPVNYRIVDFIMNLLRTGPGYTSPTAREELRRKAEELDDWEVEAYLNDIGRLPLFAAENSVVLDSTKQKAWSR